MEEPASDRRKMPERLDTLPMEILCLISEHLAIDTHTPYPDPDAGSMQCCDENETISRQTLRDMCLVSRTMASAASSYLYQTIPIQDAYTLVLLHRNLIEYPKIGNWIKRIGFGFYCMHSLKLEPLRLRRDGEDLQCYRIKKRTELEIPAEPYAVDQGVAQQIFTLHLEILGRTPRLQWLDFRLRVLHPRSVEHPGKCPRSSSPIYQLRPWLLTECSPPVLPKLETLQIIKTRRWPRQMGLAVLFDRFMALFKLRKLIWSWDDRVLDQVKHNNNRGKFDYNHGFSIIRVRVFCTGPN